jgi:diaminopimelate decarboxylase
VSNAKEALDTIDIEALAARIGTPFYLYSANAIRERIDRLKSAFHGLKTTICFAVKANSNLAILQLMADSGLGADIVSGGELRRALRAGIPASSIVFSGVGKSEEEMSDALAAGIWKFNVESHDELERLQQLARTRGVVAHVAVRINPDVDARTHDKISTGRSGNKFGVGVAEARRWLGDAPALSHVHIDGLHMHIGSQMLSLEPLRLALERLAVLWRELEAAGHRIDTIDVGGGLGVRYRPEDSPPIVVDDYASTVRHALAGFDGRIVLEPGRHLVAEAGVLLTRVVRVKQGARHDFLVLDAAMNDLMRPSLYDAWHEIIPVRPAPGPRVSYDVVGPICESGDTFAIGRQLPRCAPGDLLMITAVGAYGASMASNYNSRPLIAEVLVDDNRYAVIRRRQSYEEMMAGDQFAEVWHTP